MPYPYTFSALSGFNTAYADTSAVQRYLTTFSIATGNRSGASLDFQNFLVQCTAEMDAAMLQLGVLVPPPAGTAILPILEQMCAVGAAASWALARADSGDAEGKTVAAQLLATYDAMMGLLEREEINLVQMGMISAGWAVTPDRRLYYQAGTLQPNADGSKKVPFFTTTQQW